MYGNGTNPMRLNARNRSDFSAWTDPSVEEHPTSTARNSCSTFQFYDGKMPSAFEARDCELDRNCVFASRFKTGDFVIDSEINVYWDSSTESLMWSMLVVPADVECNLTSDAFITQRNKNTSGAFVLYGAYQSLDDGDAPIIANGSEALFDVPWFGAAPPSEFIRCELTSLVGNEMFGCCSHSADRLGHEFDNFISSRLFLEDREANDSTGKMVHHHDDPPTERPNLRQAEWSPGHPEACCGDRGHVNMPQTWLGYLAVTTRPFFFSSMKSQTGLSGRGSSFKMRPTVVAPRCNPALPSI
jgi:hypothetical protein